MLGDIYLGTALAIFLAIFGWSESIFGLSQRTKEKEADFIRKSKLTFEKYLELKKLISATQKLGQAEYTKKLASILKGTHIGAGDKGTFDKLRENSLTLTQWDKQNKNKKTVLSGLFIYLFIAGTVMLLFENNVTPFFEMSLESWMIIFQSILFIIIIVGALIFNKIRKFEIEIQSNLNYLILRIPSGE